MSESRDLGHPSRLGWSLVWALSAVGLLSRILPLFPTERLLQQFPTEDGYMMLTVSRNIAIGNGMSVADGLIPTNGVQPLATYLYALGYLPFDGDKTAGVAAALVMQLILSMISAWLLYTLGRRVCGEDGRGRLIAAIAAALWFAAPRFVAHSMNCLESGLYALFVIWTTLVFFEGSRGTPWNFKQCVGAGALLGGVFWARNDGVFFILSACLWYVYAGRSDGFEAMRARFVRALGFGSVSVLVASPWMVSNYLRFGHIMPISGQSESLGAKFGNNLAHLPASAWEALVPVLPVPEQLELMPAVIALISLLFAALIVVVVRVYPKLDESVQGLLAHSLFFFGCLATFYGLYFGAAHFMGRYLFPASPLLTLLVTMGCAQLALRTRLASRRALLAALIAGCVGVVAGISARMYLLAIPHQHWAVVNWVDTHVSDDTWVAAIQTGTLGYFHDYSLNLDGKVNVDALRAREVSVDALHEYLIGEERVHYMVDWHGLRDWYDDHAVLREHFELLVADADANLTVMRRRGIQ